MRRLPILLICVASPVLATSHSGDVSGTWRAADNPHVVMSTVRVPDGETLVIESGCTVVFMPGTRLQADGRLLARGTRALPIVMGPSATGGPGDWKGLQLVGPGPHELTQASVGFATIGVAVGGGATATLDGVSVTYCQGHGVSFAPGSSGALTGCLLTDNGGSGLSVMDASPSLDACRFDFNRRAVTVAGRSFPAVSRCAATGNVEGNGLVLDEMVPIDGAGTWTDGGLPWIVRSGTLDVAPQGEVTVLPGAIVKLGGAARIEVEGAFNAAGSTSPCTFTSLKDDGAGGDSNADGNATFPDKGDWSAIEVASGGSLRLSGAIVRHAEDGVRALGGITALRSCTIAQCLDRGAAFGPLAYGLVADTSFSDCDTGLQVAEPANVAAGRGTAGAGDGGHLAFACNGTFDVQNLGASPLPVHASWWGDLGPDPARLGGEVDTSGELAGEPPGVDAQRVLRVARAADGLTLTWPDGPSCSAYAVGVSPAPDGPFDVIARASSGPMVATDADVGPDALVFVTLAP